MWSNNDKDNFKNHVENTISLVFSDLKREIDYYKIDTEEIDIFLQSAFKSVMIKNNLKVQDNVLEIITKYIAKTLKNNPQIKDD